MPMTGAHRRTRSFAASVMPAMTTRVVRAQSVAASGGVPPGTFFNCSNMTGMTVTGVSIRTVPVTVGVRMRRNSERRVENTNWTRARITTRDASNPGPPAASAAMLVNAVWREPVASPQAATDANTAQSRTSSGWPAARKTTVGIITAPGSTRQAICRARPTLSGSGIFASGWRRPAELFSIAVQTSLGSQRHVTGTARSMATRAKSTSRNGKMPRNDSPSETPSASELIT